MFLLVALAPEVVWTVTRTHHGQGEHLVDHQKAPKQRNHPGCLWNIRAHAAEYMKCREFTTKAAATAPARLADPRRVMSVSWAEPA